MSPRGKNQLLFIAALVVLIASGVAAIVAISRFLAAQEWVAHSREVQSALGQVNTVVSRAGRTRTEYIDSGDPDHLHEYQAAIGQVSTPLQLLKKLTIDNPLQQAELLQLQGLVDERVSLMQQSVALRERNVSTLENQARNTQRIVSVAARMDTTIQTMQDEEQRLLDVRLRRTHQWEQFVAICLAASFLISSLLFVVNHNELNRELERRERAENSLRELSARTMHLQDEERRKFSRELHDSLGQYLAGIKMNLGILPKSKDQRATIDECAELADAALAECRTISHLLHPPMLDEAGFVSAAHWYVEGFSKRSGIPTKISLPSDLGRFSPACELAMFRVLQECLTNIHRHSQCTEAEIDFHAGLREMTLTVRDNGKGMTSEVLQRFNQGRNQLGVGLSGMRERLRELNGKLMISSNGQGTAVTASMPRV